MQSGKAEETKRGEEEVGGSWEKLHFSRETESTGECRLRERERERKREKESTGERDERSLRERKRVQGREMREA